MDHRITQCPRCGTSFRVTEAHLAVAAGAVRCGSCLHIFNAREHWAEDAASTPEPLAQSANANTNAADEEEPDLDDLIIDDDALFDDNTPLFAEKRTNDSSLPGTSLLDDSLLDDPSPGSRRFDDPLVDTGPADRSRGREPLFNEVDFSTDSSGRFSDGLSADDDFSLIDDAPEELTNAFTDLGSWEEDATPRFGRVQDLDEELSASDEEWTRDLLRDDEPAPEPVSGPAFSATDETPQPASPSALFDNAEETPALEDFGLVAAEPGSRREPTFGIDDPVVPDAGLPADDDLRFLDDDPLPATSPAPLFEAAEPETAPAAPIADLNPEFLDTPPAHRNNASDASIEDRDEPGSPGLAESRPEHGESAGDEPDTVVTDASYADAPYAGALSLAPLGATTDSTSSTDALASLDRLAAEPLQIHRFKHEPRWPRVLLSLAAVALLLLLAGQYVYKNFDALARSQARPWLTQACGMIGCALPPQTDVGQIRSGNLIVRSHPTRQGALVVDAIITNLATFPQPYPQLLLQFSDLNGTPVAGRRFVPAEYLAGELSGASLMPSQQPVHIALELVDPGPQAVNYALSVVAPQPAP